MNFSRTIALCPHPLQRTGVAAALRKTGPSTDGADQVHIWGHLPSLPESKSLPSPIQRTQTGMMWDLSSRGDGLKDVCAGVGLTRAGAGRQTVVLDAHACTIGRPGLRATNCWAGDPTKPSGKAPARTLATVATDRAGPKPTCLHRMYSNETSRGGRLRLPCPCR